MGCCRDQNMKLMPSFLRTFALLLLSNAIVLSAQDPVPDSGHDYLVTLETEYGNMMILLFDGTPMHKENFVDLARAGVYDGNVFHRVIENFMIQSGDPATSNLPGRYDASVIPPHVPAEINPQFSHRRGTVGAARYGGERNPLKNSSPTQFYIVRHDRAAPHLDGEYTVFGQVMSGLEVIDSIAVRPTDDRDRPVEDVRILRVRVDRVTREDIMKFYNYSYD
jgi:cyclophilin family peptidyl-prolyl cis-trans isomerase